MEWKKEDGERNKHRDKGQDQSTKDRLSSAIIHPRWQDVYERRKAEGKNERERENEERIDRVKIVIFIVYCRRCVRYSCWPIGDC